MSFAGEINLKTFHDVRDFLMEANDRLPPKDTFPIFPKNNYDLVFEGIYLGNASIAKKVDKLKSMGVTHVVNASQGTKRNQIDTKTDFYKPAGIGFHGIPAADIMTYQILPHLEPAAHFIHQARLQGGVVYIHCQQGVSRSATVVLAYLMLHWNMPLITAARTVREKREIFPNEGFLKQLCVLEKQLQS